MWRRCFGNWEDPAFKPFGWWPGLLILAFPFFLVAGFSFLFPLTILVLLIPLDLKAYRIWQKHVLPNSGRHELWFGAWPKPAVNPGEERIGAAAEEKKAEHKPRLIGKSLGWGVVQELLNVEKQDWKGAISVFVILYFIMLAFCLPLFLFLAWEAGDISEFWEILLVIPWALAVIMFLLSLFALLADGIDSHFVIRSAGSLNKGTIPCSSDWVHLLPLPGSLVIRKCLHWLALHFLKLSSPLLVLIPALFFMGDIGGAALLCLFLGLMAVVMLGVVLNVVLGYREPSRRRRWGA